MVWTQEEIAEALDFAREDLITEIDNAINAYHKNGRWSDFIIDMKALIGKAEDMQ